MMVRERLDMQTKMLAGQVAVVTGASSGLGVRFAKVLHAVGAQVASLALADPIFFCAASAHR